MKNQSQMLSECPTCTFSLTVVGEACLAETHEQVLLDFIRRHELRANRTVEAWRENTKRKHWGPWWESASLITCYWYVHKAGCGTVSLVLILWPAWPFACMNSVSYNLTICLLHISLDVTAGLQNNCKHTYEHRCDIYCKCIYKSSE